MDKYFDNAPFDGYFLWLLIIVQHFAQHRVTSVTGKWLTYMGAGSIVRVQSEVFVTCALFVAKHAVNACLTASKVGTCWKQRHWSISYKLITYQRFKHIDVYKNEYKITFYNDYREKININSFLNTLSWRHFGFRLFSRLCFHTSATYRLVDSRRGVPHTCVLWTLWYSYRC